MKYAAIVAYDGGEFAGWQKQPNAVTVQETLEHAVSQLSHDHVNVVAAGRTDGGVHSRGQVVSFIMEKNWKEDRLLLAINAHLPKSVRITRVRQVPDDFHARRSALWREYRYFVWHGSFCYPHISKYVWWNKRSWNTEKVKDVCRLLEGTHDFRAFCRVSECPENSVRSIIKLRVRSHGQLTVFNIRGNAFLTNMVRIMIGNIDLVGIGQYDTNWIQELLSGKSRIFSGTTVPASGLFFWRAGYNIFSS